MQYGIREAKWSRCMLKEQRRKVAARALSSSSARWRGWPPVGRGGRWRQCEAMGLAETLKRRATTGAKRRRAILQARARAAEAGRALKCGAEPGRGGASGEETGRWAEATANGLACGSRGFEAGRQRLRLPLEGYPVRGYAPGRRAREEKNSPVFVVCVAQQC